MRVGQKEIAERLGINQASVSRALNGSPLISPDLRVRVRDLADRLGYSPNYMARGLISGKSMTVSMVQAGGMYLGGVHPEWVTSLHEAVSARGYRVRLDSIADCGTIIREGSADGIIVLGPAKPESGPHEPPHPSFPVVYVDCEPEPGQTGVVSADNAGGVRMAVDHLAGLGHVRIAFVGLVDGCPLCGERHRGYLSGMLGNGLEPRDDLTLRYAAWPSDPEAILMPQPGFVDLVARGATAIVTTGSLLACSVVRTLKAKGLRVPGDVAVVGFDDTLLTRYTEPSITVVKPDIKGVSDAAADMLTEWMEKGTRPGNIVVPAGLIRREST